MASDEYEFDTLVVDVMKVKTSRRDAPRLGWALNPMVNVLLRERKEDAKQREKGGLRR